MLTTAPETLKARESTKRGGSGNTRGVTQLYLRGIPQVATPYWILHTEQLIAMVSSKIYHITVSTTANKYPIDHCCDVKLPITRIS